MAEPNTDLPVTTTTMLEEVQAVEPDFYKPIVAYEFSNGRKFEDGRGAAAPAV